MTILITGGAGYIGSHFVKIMKQENVPLLIVDNLSTGHKEAITAGKLFKLDLKETEKLEDIFKSHSIDTIVHFAGSTIVPESMANPLKYYENNTQNTLRLIQLAVKYGVKNFIFSSTCATYGETSICTEDTPQNPINPYGWSKLMSERMIMDTAASSDLKYVILRYFNVAGADPDGDIGQSFPGATHLLQVAAEAAVGKRKSIQIFGDDFPTPDGSCERDFIHVTDLVRAHLDAINYLTGGGGSTVLNCGYGKGYSVKKVIAEVLKQAPVKFEVKITERREGDPAIVKADNKKICQLLGWEPKYNDIGFIVKTHIDWQKNRRY